MIERVPLLVVAAHGAPSLEIARVAREAGCSPILCDDRSSARRALVANRLFLAVVETGNQLETAADLCSWLRQQPGGRQIRVIACATGNWTALLPLIDAGADDLATFTGPEQTLGSRLTIAKARLLSRHRESPVEFPTGVTGDDPDRPYLLPHELLTRLRQMIWDEQELPRLYRSFVEGAAASFGYSQIAIYTLDGDALELQHLVGFDRRVDRIPLDRGVIGRTVRTDRPNVVEDVTLDPDFIGGVSNISSEICVPIHADGRVIGAINIESIDNDRLDERDLPLILALRDHLEAAIARIQGAERASAALAASDRAMANAPVGLFELDADLHLIRVNRATADLLGIAAGDGLGRALDELFEIDQSLLERAMQSARGGIAASVAASRGERAFEIRLSGDANRFNGAIRDVGAEQQRAARLEYTEWALDQIAATNIVICTVDRSGWMTPIEGVRTHPLRGVERWTDPVDLRSLIDERDWPAIAAALATPGSSGPVLRVRLRTETGERGWLHIRFAPAGANGTRLMIARDASGDAARDASLVAAYHRLQISFDNPIAPSALLDASGRLIDVSLSMANLLGWDPDEMEGLPFQQITYPEDVETALQHFRQVTSGELPFCVARRRFFHRDGRVVPLLVHLAPVPIDTERVGRELLVTVVSLEREAEIEYQLRAVQSRYDSLVNDLPIVTYTSPNDDQDQRLHFLGPQAAKILGYSAEHLSVASERHSDRYYEYIHPDDMERVNAADERVERENAPFDETYRFIRGDGRVIWVRAQSVPVIGEPEQAAYWQGVITEVTELKEAELAALARERRLDALLAAAPILVAALDRDAAIVWINDAVEPLLGYRAADLVSGQATLDIHPDDREVLRREFGDVLHEATPAATIDIRFRHRETGWQRFRLDIRARRGDNAPELLLYGWPVEGDAG